MSGDGSRERRDPDQDPNQGPETGRGLGNQGPRLFRSHTRSLSWSSRGEGLGGESLSDLTPGSPDGDDEKDPRPYPDLPVRTFRPD